MYLYTFFALSVDGAVSDQLQVPAALLLGKRNGAGWSLDLVWAL